MRPLALGFVVALAAVPASAKVFECSFPTLVACESDIATFCAGMKERGQVVRIDAAVPGQPITGTVQVDGKTYPIDGKTTDYQEHVWGQVFLFASPEDNAMTIVVNKPAGAEFSLSRPSPRIKYTRSGRCTQEGMS